MFEIQVDESKHKISPDKVSSILISNAATITSDAIQLAMEKNIDVVFLDKFGDPYGRIWYPKIGSTVFDQKKAARALKQ
jgi:CRISPR-associated protein Cas1